MHALVLLCINQHTKFEELSFTDSKDMIKAKTQKGHVTLTTPLLGGVCHPKAIGLNIVYLCAKFDNSKFSRSRDITRTAKFIMVP